MPTEYTNYEGMVHIFFQLGPIVGKGKQAVSQVAEAAKKEAPKANFVIQADEEAPTSVLSELLGVLKPLMDAPLCASTDEAG